MVIVEMRKKCMVSSFERLFMQEIAENLEALKRNLTNLGYRFAAQNDPILYAESVDQIKLNALADQFGPLPLFFQMWYEHFRSVDFTQHPSQLHSDCPSPIAGLGYNCVLIFQSIDSAMSMRTLLVEKNIPVERQEKFRAKSSFLFPTGAIASNCCPKGVWIPDESKDPILYDDGAGPISFSCEIRSALEHGGFPFWSKLARRGKSYLPIKHSPDFLQILLLLMQGIVFNSSIDFLRV